MEREHSRRSHRARFPAWLDTILVVAVLLLLTALYVLVMHLAVPSSSSDSSAADSSRDALYFGLHGAVLVVGWLIAWGIAVLLRRSVLSLVALFAGWFLVAMIGAQIATFELACHGHNDIIRHWHCTPGEDTTS